MRGPNANELRGAVGDLPILTNEEQISLSLEYYLPMQEEIIKDQPSTSKDVEPKKRMNGGTIPVEVFVNKGYFDQQEQSIWGFPYLFLFYLFIILYMYLFMSMGIGKPHFHLFI